MNTTNRERVTVALAGLSAGVGIFMPSSIGGTIEPRLTILSCLILWLLTVMIGFTNGYSVIRSTIALLIIAELFLATLLSPLGEFTPGALPPYLLLVTILSLNIRSPGKISSAAVTVFGGISAVLQIFALSLVFGLDPVNEVNSSLYRAYSDELYEIMVLLYAKPVTVFASHSVAAFMYFAFLVTHAEVFKVAKTRMRRIFNAVSVAIFLYLLIHLTSTTGFVLFAIASVWLAYRIIPYAVCRSPLPALALIVLVGVGVFYSVKSMETSPTEIVVGTLALSESGFLGRYTGGGRLQSTYEYLIENPFRPIGLTYDPRVSLGDNFIAEYIIRGSVPLYMAVLIASALFWRRNLGSRGAAAGFFLFFLACDIGYPLLPYYRTAGAIILFVIVWNYCSTSRMRGGGDRGGERNYHSTENYDSLR